MAELATLGITKLATRVDISLNTTTKQTLYTVPTGYKCFITQIVVRDASGSLTTAAYGFGYDANATDVITSTTHTELTGNTLYTVLNPKVGAKMGVAADVLGVKVNTTQAFTVDIDVFGYLVAA